MSNLIELRIGRQTFEFDCGAKALQLVMEYYGVEIREDELMKELNTSSKGTNYVDMVSVAKRYGFDVLAESGISLHQLKQFIDEGYPVIVIVQAWADRYMTLADWTSNYDYGHYAVVIGYQEHIIIFEDPASIRRTWMTEDEFLARWHDIDLTTGEKVENFAMVLKGKQPATGKASHMD